MSDSIKFEFEAPSATIFGTVDYKYWQNSYSGNDPRTNSKLTIDWNTVQIKDIQFNKTVHPFLESLSETFENESKENSTFKQGFGLGIIENNKAEFKKKIEDLIIEKME